MWRGGGGVGLFWWLFFIKVHAWRPVNLLWEDFGAGVFLCVLRKYLMAASELSVLQNLRFLLFNTLNFII